MQSITLREAYLNKDINTIKSIFESSINIDEEDYNENTFLHYICRDKSDNNLEIIKLLKDKGANINHKNKDGDISLHHACFNGNIDKIMLLIHLG